MTAIVRFFTAVNGSVKGVLNTEELYRSVLTALGSGTTIGLVTLIVQSIMDHAGAIAATPTAASALTMFLTLVLDLLRRLNHGAVATSKPELGMA